MKFLTVEPSPLPIRIPLGRKYSYQDHALKLLLLLNSKMVPFLTRFIDNKLSIEIDHVETERTEIGIKVDNLPKNEVSERNT